MRFIQITRRNSPVILFSLVTGFVIVTIAFITAGLASLQSGTFPKSVITSTSIPNTHEAQSIQSICLLKNVTGHVLSRDAKSWKKNDDICSGDRSFRFGKFVRAKMQEPEETPIFVYEAKSDVHMSNIILKKGRPEDFAIDIIHKIMKENKDLVFIDVGAKLGLYSLPVAKLGRKVIAVEVFDKNIARLCRSMDTGYLDDNIIIIHNSLSNVHDKVELGYVERQLSRTYSRKKNPLEESSGAAVYSIILDDLLEIFNLNRVVLKLDIETADAKVFEGAKSFFNSVEVTYLLMNFSLFRRTEQEEMIVKFLHQQGLRLKSIPANYTQWRLFKRVGI